MEGDVDITPIAALLADASRAKVLNALGDGRALPASVLAGEAGVSASTVSAHLAKLVDGGLLRVERHGRHRYFRFASPKVATLLETMALLSPTAPVRSLREGNRAQALRSARTCYDHLAGRLGVRIMRSLLDRGAIAGGDGYFDVDDPGSDHLSGQGSEIDYELTEDGQSFLDKLGVHIPPGRRRLVRYCVDWSEQQHHLAGRLGRAILDHTLREDWVRRSSARALRVTDSGRAALLEHFGIEA
ncbi:MAG TPA: winged helix-turn-helix domain-containing protein [Stackebrandtia sp.]|jgi:DNA-binding transcriptional ArsR family regulator|uniref:ArsR/SmtB family transcription factor n=1 Tax=Stackebrandtia sp. TaxID=2023065 RepID=UPI002D317708|nr:winged helix-turn-helix domain-containing protein [Stackebrandtia sp.]HZE37533.1 winged helix-turn-helix domain-containing protein [Stackebrandtia sp.]